MNGNELQKPKKSIIWIVATIWANIIIIGLFLVIILRVLLGNLIVQLFGETGGMVLMWLILILGFVFAIRLGVKAVLKKSVIELKDVMKISIGVALVPVIFQLGVVLLTITRAGLKINPTTCIEFVFADVLYFLATYLWLKREIKKA